jgi:hypothetical protein
LKQGYEHKLRVIIPSNVEHYVSDYRTNWCQGPVTNDTIDLLEKVLTDFQNKNPSGLLEMMHPGGDILQSHYDDRHDIEVMFSDEVYAFQVNNSTGTQDTINKAEKAGLKISLHKKYSI